jgi:hypothetical protein
MTTPMDTDEGAIVSRVAALAKAGSLQQCAMAAREGRRTVADPLKAGWLYYYEYKCLYTARMYQEAYRLFHEMMGPKPKPIVLTENNAIWVHSVAMELAFRVKDVQAIDAIANKAKKLASSQPARVTEIENTRQLLLKQA